MSAALFMGIANGLRAPEGLAETSRLEDLRQPCGVSSALANGIFLLDPRVRGNPVTNPQPHSSPEPFNSPSASGWFLKARAKMSRFFAI
ncbi:hypothetical protein PSEWESI4_01782 [Pseudomonas carbonaria]|uniref:Uncharacterized protein n=1 Tax=Zestomonas carbonaria TaxID=2762745 RepID=A0A7U7EM07_9GAMM|nr:hypothetical protein PSEWESI4_01782 [Pseudomonas carbonaria]